MDNRVILQVPMSRNLKQSAEMVALDYGFSSLQETVRVILNKLARRELSVSITEAEEIVKLSPAAKKRYKKMSQDFKTGQNIYQAKDADDLLQQLRA